MSWTLNVDGTAIPSAPRNSFFHSGAGANRIWVDPDHDLVVAVRWVSEEHFDAFIGRVLSAIT